jgi:hypothetical protein
MTADVTIHFPDDFDERDALEMPLRGYFGDVTVELPDGNHYQLYFYDITRLGQTLDAEVGCGRSFYTEPGLIVLPEVTVEAIRAAVPGLVASGYFDHLKPVAPAVRNGRPG